MRLFDSLAESEYISSSTQLTENSLPTKINYCLTDKLDFCKLAWVYMLMTEHVLIMPQTHPTNQAQILISMGGYAHKVMSWNRWKCAVTNQTEMWSQKPPAAVSEVIKLKIFLGGMPPDPLVWACYARHDSITIDCFPPPWEKSCIKPCCLSWLQWYM